MFQNICMVFAGDPDRGKRFYAAARERGWRIHIAAGSEQAVALCSEHAPDIVIIDDFPESEAARSLFYQLRTAGKGPFLLLNDSPEEMRFSGLGALSFLRMIKRDPEPADLISAVVRLMESNRKSRCRQVAQSTPAGNEPRRGIHPAPVEAGAKAR